MTPAPRDAPIGIYLHVPFCSHICPYCDFNTYAGQDALIPRYVTSLVAEIRRQGRALAVDGPRRASTIYIGGGTPSLLAAADVAGLIAACREEFALSSDAEVTIEANPTS